MAGLSWAALSEKAKVTEGAQQKLDHGLIQALLVCIIQFITADLLSPPSNYPSGLISTASASRKTYCHLSLISNDVTIVHLLEQNSNSIPVWPTSLRLDVEDGHINNCDTSGFVVARRAVGLETHRRPWVCLCTTDALLIECMSSMDGN